MAALERATFRFERGELGKAEAAFREAMASGNSEVVPVAAIGLGNALQDQGRLEEAAAAYRVALDDREHGGLAAFSLGTVLRAEGRADEAEAAFRQAMASGSLDALGPALGLFARLRSAH